MVGSFCPLHGSCISPEPSGYCASPHDNCFAINDALGQHPRSLQGGNDGQSRVAGLSRFCLVNQRIGFLRFAAWGDLQGVWHGGKVLCQGER
jgi:hypothetical protein